MTTTNEPVCPNCGEDGFDMQGYYRCGSVFLSKQYEFVSPTCKANRCEKAAKWLMVCLAGCCVKKDGWSRDDIMAIYASAKSQWPELAP